MTSHETNPSGDRRLDTLEFRAQATRANNAILGLFGAPTGSVSVSSGFASGTADLIIDVTGYYR